MPQLRAYINLLIQIAQLQQSVQNLIRAIEQADDKIKLCVKVEIVDAFKLDLQSSINQLQQPIDDALSTVNFLERQIKNVIESPTDPAIVTTSLEGFLNTAEEGFEKLGLEVEEFGDSEVESSPTLTANIETDTVVLEIVDGLIVSANSANTP